MEGVKEERQRESERIEGREWYAPEGATQPDYEEPALSSSQKVVNKLLEFVMLA